jgi:hypothetical protein
MTTVIKIKLATYYIAKCGLVIVPIGVSRLKSGAWQISQARFAGLKQYTFYDQLHGGAVGSLHAVIAILQGKEKKKLRALETEERECKVTKLEKVGITYYTTVNGTTNEHRFCVSTPGVDSGVRTIYIGNDNTYLKNWEEAMSTAIDIREQWERERTIKSYWTGMIEQATDASEGAMTH